MLKSTHFVKHISPLEILQSSLVCNRLLIHVTPLSEFNVIISIRQHIEASSTWSPNEPLMQQNPGDHKTKESHLEF